MDDIIEMMLNNWEFDSLVDEQYWTQNNKTEKFIDMVRNKCLNVNVEFDDNFDFETEWWNIYDVSEKGLS